MFSTLSYEVSSTFNNRTDVDPNPFDCVTTVALNLPINVTLGRYNVVTNQDVGNPCLGGSGTFSQPVLTCSTVNSVSITGIGGSGYNTSNSVSGSQTAGESTVISLTAKNAGSINPITKSSATVNVTFSANGSRSAVQNGLGVGYTCEALTFKPIFNIPASCN